MYKISPHLNIVETNSGKYAYHSLFGNLVKLKNDDYILLKQLQNNQLILNPENDQLEALHNLHFISSSCEDDYSLLNTVIDKYEQSVKDSHSITKLLLTVTDKCMLACSYCYVPEAPTGIEINSCNNNPICKRNSDMTWDVAKQAIDSFAEIIRENHQKKIHIRFHGGEPLIKYDLIKQSIEYANEIFGNVLVEYHMNTNGILMSKEKAEFFVQQNIEIEVSVDGPKEIHDAVRAYPNGKGSYDDAINAVKILLDAGFPIDRMNYAVTLSSDNLNALPQIIDMANEQGIKAIEINTLLFEHPKDILNLIEERVSKLVEARIYGTKQGVKVSGKWFKLFERLQQPVINYCGRIGQQIGVDANGDIFLCTGLAKTYGTIKEWKKIFYNEEYYIAAMRIVGNIKECRGCEIEGMCAGGCIASVIKSYHSLDSAERKECEFRKRMVKKLIEHHDLLMGNGIELDEVDKSYVPTIDLNTK